MSAGRAQKYSQLGKGSSEQAVQRCRVLHRVGDEARLRDWNTAGDQGLALLLRLFVA